MNKKTLAVDEMTYRLIVDTLRKGFVYNGVHHKPNPRIAVILILEYNLGLRVGDVLRLRLDSICYESGRYRLDIVEQKTKKERCFTVPTAVYEFISQYAERNGISPQARLFPICERTVNKHLKAVCDYLGVVGIGTHSFRKAFATNAYENSNYNIELVRTLLQHSSSAVTQRYINISSREIENALQKNINLCEE